MTALVVKQSVIDWFLTEPGATREEVDEWVKNGEIVVEDENHGN
jgi:hypothetical protein